jgi:glutamyl/glutaminyl-tRNA synthetase
MSEYDRWEGRFAAPEYIFGTAPNAFLAAQKKLLPKRGRALAVSDGEGRNGVWLAEQGVDVLSIDFSPAAQAKARALAQTRGVTIATELVDLAQLTRLAVTGRTASPPLFDVLAILGREETRVRLQAARAAAERAA